MADGFNSTLAAVLGTFPNTTFSQNNGVIRLTGVCSRHVGLLLAGMLVLLGSIPLVSAVFQMLPGGVLHGATLLMFALIMLAGLRVMRMQADRRGALTMLAVCSLLALGLARLPALLAAAGAGLPGYAALLLSFPVATGTLIAMTWESLRPAGPGGRRSPASG